MQFGGQCRDFRTAIQTDAEAHHVKLGLRESRNAGAVEDVAQDFVVESAAKIVGHALEQSDLLSCVVILVRVFGGCQVREYGSHVQLWVFLYRADELREIGFIKAEAVHAGVQFDVDVELLDLRMFLQHFDQFAEVVKVENFRFQVLLHHHIEAVCFGAQYDDGGTDVPFAQAHAFVGVGHR